MYSSWLSSGLYICWLIGIIYAHAEGSLNTDNVMVAQGKLFQDISEFLKACSLQNADDPISFLCICLLILFDTPDISGDGWSAWEQW